MKVKFKNHGILYRGNCFDYLPKMKNNSIHLLLTDPPYGTTSLQWDKVLPFNLLWEVCLPLFYSDVCSAVIFGDEPFSSQLRLSNISMYKYDLYWRKTRPSGFVNAKLKPLKDIETITIFSRGYTCNGSDKNMIYNPQGLIEVNKVWKRKNLPVRGGTDPTRASHKKERIIQFGNYPRQVLDYPVDHGRFHPTQKPVALFEYLINTYTFARDRVLDCCAGSGTTAIAAINTNRRFRCIEKDNAYFDAMVSRVEEHLNVRGQ